MDMGSPNQFDLSLGYAQGADPSHLKVARKAADACADMSRQASFRALLQSFLLVAQPQWTVPSDLFSGAQNSATESINLAIRALMVKKDDINRPLHIGVIDPTPSFIRKTMKRYGVAITPIPEARLVEGQVNTLPDGLDAVFVTTPNNPTGQHLQRPAFRALAEHCRDQDMVLMADFSFRLFAPYETWRQYDVLMESGCSFIGIEDTGKAFAMGGLKLGMMVASPDLKDICEEVAGDFGPVSASNLIMASSMIDLTIRRQGPVLRAQDLPVHTVLERNEAALAQLLAFHQIQTGATNFAIIGLKGVFGHIYAHELRKTAGIDVVPLSDFYAGYDAAMPVEEAVKQKWNGVRVGLSARPEVFSRAVKHWVACHPQIQEDAQAASRMMTCHI